MKTTPTVAHLAAAKRYLGHDVLPDVLAAKARLYGWRRFAPHTDEERAEHATGVAVVAAHEAARVAYDLPGADPMGDS